MIDRRRHVIRALSGSALLAACAVTSAQSTVPVLEPLAVGAPGILGRQGNRDARVSPSAISADGRWVVFGTAANNLDPTDRDAVEDVYLAAADGSTTQRISGTMAGVPKGNAFRHSISPDGGWISWIELQGADQQQSRALQLHERSTSRTVTVAASAPGDGNWFSAGALSHDAARLAFLTAVPLVAEDVDQRDDVYIWHRADGEFRMVSRTPDGGRLGRISGDVAITPDGRYVAFASAQDSATPGSTSAVHVVDLTTGQRDEIRAPDGGPLDSYYGLGLDLSSDGRWLVLTTRNPLSAKDINDRLDVYVFDRATRDFELASVSSGGAVGDCDSQWPSIGGDGRSVAFESCASNFHPGTSNATAVYLRDRSLRRTLLLSRPLSGGPLDSTRFHATLPSLSIDGSRVAFASASEQLVEGDSNRRTDVFVADLSNLDLRRVGLAAGAALPAGASGRFGQPSLVDPAFASRSGEHVLFSTSADNLLLSRSTGALRIDTRHRVIADALPWSSSAPSSTVEIAQGISDDGAIVLVRRAVIWSGWFVPPPPDLPRDLWLFGPEFGALQVDSDPMLGLRQWVEAAVLSGNGRRVVFLSRRIDPPGAIGVYRFDVDTRITRRIDLLPSGDAPVASAGYGLALSNNGRWLVFSSIADGLVPGDSDGSADLFLADLDDGSLLRLVHPATGLPLLSERSERERVAVSDDGQRVAFLSRSDDLGPGTPESTRLFLLDRGLGRLLRLSRPSADGFENASAPSISADGRRVAFLDLAVLRLIELGPDASIIGEPTDLLPSIRASNAAISADGYAVALSSGASFSWLPGWLAATAAVPFLLRLPEPSMFGDGFEPSARAGIGQ